MRNAAGAYVALFFLLLGSYARGQKIKFKEKDQTVPLSAVVAATESTLNDYQTYAESPEGIKDGIPPLATADFDFKTVVDVKGGPSINLFIFTLGATWDKQTTNDLDFQYFPHVEPRSETFAFNGTEAPKTLHKAIIDTLTASATEIKKAQDTQDTEPNKLDLCQLTLALSFGVTTDIQGGVKIPFQIITVSALLDRSKAEKLAGHAMPGRETATGIS
ncbi:MAG: hypothetical protein WCD57_07505 [Acidobacteriaceae bacterium]